EDGEVLVRSPTIFAGYHKDPEATREVLGPDGWLRTGDVGELDADGFLTLTDRKKDIIVTAGGKNVAPQNLENALKAARELAQAIVPFFLRSTLGASFTIIGIIEGIASGVAVGLVGLAGFFSDRAGERRKPWIAVGYGLTTLSRPLLALAHGWGLVLGSKLADRIGKAARTAPRDALIRDSTEPHQLGSSFGYHRAMDSAGAVVGPLAAVGL